LMNTSGTSNYGDTGLHLKSSLMVKVDTVCEQMVYAEATSVLPLIASYVYHMRSWEVRHQRKWNRIFEQLFHEEFKGAKK